MRDGQTGATPNPRTKEIPMSPRTKLLLAAFAGVVMGATGVGIAWAKARPPAYMVVEYEITDDAGFDEFIKGDAKIGSPRIFLARHAKGVTL